MLLDDFSIINIEMFFGSFFLAWSGFYQFNISQVYMKKTLPTIPEVFCTNQKN